MAFENYKGSIKLGAGLTPASEGYPLMQTSDIQATEDGTRLDEYLKDLKDETGVAFTTDHTLSLSEGVLSVNTAKSAEADNTLPITSAAVHTQLGNIEVLLGTI